MAEINYRKVKGVKEAEHTESGEKHAVFEDSEGNVYVSPINLFKQRQEEAKPQLEEQATTKHQRQTVGAPENR
jgi:hypothetical protein